MRVMMCVVLVSGCIGCSGSDSGIGTMRGAAMQEADCVSQEQRACTCEGGSMGTQRCDVGWGECQCAPPVMNFENPVQGTGGAGMGGGTEPEPMAVENCDPGLYLGTYECDLVVFGLPTTLTGDVAFNLEINEQVVECASDNEFCFDLVISEGSGKLFGIAVGWGFEAALKGGLNCQTGEFRTEPLDGIYGSAVSSDPNDPNALWMVQQPPAGMFKGDLTGQHVGGTPQLIEGEWSLVQEGFASCTGSFTTELQP